MAEELMPIYEENVRGEMAQGEAFKDNLVQRVIAQNTDIIDALEARTDSLIDTIMIERADTENALQTYQKELIQEQVDQVRDIEKRVTETKEAILEAIAAAEADIKQTEKDLKEAEWELSKEIAHQKHHHHHHHHSFSHGYGYHSAFYHDPKETEEKIASLKTKITGFKDKIASLKAQIVQFKEDWKLSLKAARSEFSALQGDSLADWEENLALARSDYAAVLDAKEETFAQESAFTKKLWEGVLAAARDEFDTRISAIVDTMDKATAQKKATIQVMYDELLEKIETLHEHKHHHDIKFGDHDEHAKHELRQALDDKLAAIQKRCKAQEAEISAFGPAIRARFADELDKEDKRFKKVTEATAAQCTAAIDVEEAAIDKSTFAYD